jgi:cation/acetate symporter
MQAPSLTPQSLRRRVRWLTLGLLMVWATVSFGTGFWANELSLRVWGWPLHFWIAAQGSVLVFLLLIIVHATLVNRWEAQAAASEDTPQPAA